MRTFAIGIAAVVLLAAACASPTAIDAESIKEAEHPVSTSPVTASSVAASSVTTSPVTTSLGTTSPPPTSDVAPSDESVAPGGDQEDEPEPSEQEPTLTTQPPKEIPTTPIQPVGPQPSGSVAAAIADLTTRLGIAESSVTLVSQEEVIWPDGSLGCPQPGMAYTQALVSGSLIVLESGGRSYEYHSGSGGDSFYCATPTPPVIGDHGDT